MSDVWVSLNKAEVGRLLKSAETQALLGEIAGTIANSCGDGYVSEVRVSGSRARASVTTNTVHAFRSNQKHNTLVRALLGGK